MLPSRGCQRVILQQLVVAVLTAIVAIALREYLSSKVLRVVLIVPIVIALQVATFYIMWYFEL